MAVPYTFAAATTGSALPLSELDANFATAITLGTTPAALGNTVSTLDGLSLSNVTIISASTPLPNAVLANSSITLGNTSVALGGSVSRVNAFSATPRVVSSSANLSAYTINTDVTDLFTVTGQNQNTTISTSGTPQPGQQLLVQLSGSSGKTITWPGTSFFAAGASSPQLPSSFGGPTGLIYMLVFIYSDSRSRWVLVGGQVS